LRSDLLERWLAELLAAPGLTAIKDQETARRFLLEDALRGVPYVESTRGRVVDLGSGGGSPGVPIAASLPDRGMTLVEAEGRKCEFLRRVTTGLPNVDVVWGRAEEQEIEGYGVALAKALAKPPVAAELALPLVEQGGIALLWCGESVDVCAIERVAVKLSGELEANDDGLLVLRKTGPTPPGFPRKTGIAKKRPLG
jgi:16S rRNA (guanine527-N7)-methyltransferase